MSVKHYRLSDGVDGFFIKNERFNTTAVSFNFYMPLCEKTAAEMALLPFILTTSGAEYSDFSALNLKLKRLYGAKLDASAEKVGDFQLLKMRISVINDKYTFESESLLKQAVDMLLSLLFNPKTENGAFCADDLQREKRKAVEHVKSELAEKRIFAKNRLIGEMFAGDPYGVPKCGRVEDIEAITGESLLKSMQKMLESAYVRVHVIGSAVPSGLFEEVTKRFDISNRSGITDIYSSAPVKPAENVTEIEDRMEVKQGKLVLGFSSEMWGDDDSSLPLMIAADIFGGGPYSKLFSNVREKMSLCYYCSASSVRQKGFVAVDSGVEPANAQKAKTEILNQLTAVQNGDFSDFEFESSIKSIKDSLHSYNDSQNALDAWYSIKALNRNEYSPEEIAEKLSSVTREQVVSAAKGIKLHTVYRLLPKEGM